MLKKTDIIEKAGDLGFDEAVFHTHLGLMAYILLLSREIVYFEFFTLDEYMKNISFLIVDQDIEALEELEQTLVCLDYENVENTDNTSDAWVMMRIRDFDCIISAWEMPDISGLALLRITRDNDKLYNIPFILTHSAFTEFDVIQAGQAGVTGLLVKPYQAKAVEHKINLISEITAKTSKTEAENKLEEGLLLIEENSYENALEILDELTQKNESAEVYYNIGYIKTTQKEYEEAIVAFRKATQLDRLYAKAFEGMGRAYKALGRNEDAQKCFQKAADIYIGKEKIQDAEVVLNEIIQINPESVNVFNSLGVLYRRKGDLQTALINYRKALKVHPDEPSIYYNIGRLYVEMKRPKESKFYFKRAVKLNPTFEEAEEVLKAIEQGTI